MAKHKEKSPFKKGAEFARKTTNGNRQLRVGEELRHILADILRKGDFPTPELSRFSITITQVQVSPDLKNAVAFVMPLGGEEKEKVIELLKENASFFRHHISKALATKCCPVIKFILDDIIDYAQKMDILINKHCTVADEDDKV